MDDDVKRIAPERSRGGAWVRIGDEEYKIAPMSLDSLQELQEKITSLQTFRGGLPDRAQMSAIYEIIHTALKRNYPSLELDEVREMIDIANFPTVLEAVLSTSGFKRVKPGEAAAPVGEAQALTGTTSTSP